MPLPALLIPILLSAASAAANYQAQKKVNKARTAATSEARLRRERKEKESAASAQSTADLLVKAGKDEKTRAGELEERYKAAGRGVVNPARPAGLPLDASRVSPVTSTVQDTRLRDRALAEADAQARGRARLDSFGDVMVGNQIAVGRNAADIDESNAGVRNWMESVLPAQLNAANLAGRDWNTFADVLQAASMLTGYASLAKGAAAKGAATATQGASASVAPAVTSTPIGTTTSFTGWGDPSGISELIDPSLMGTATNFMQPSQYELAWLRGMGGGKLPPVRF